MGWMGVLGFGQGFVFLIRKLSLTKIWKYQFIWTAFSLIKMTLVHLEFLLKNYENLLQRVCKPRLFITTRNPTLFM